MFRGVDGGGGGSGAETIDMADGNCRLCGRCAGCFEGWLPIDECGGDCRLMWWVGRYAGWWEVWMAEGKAAVTVG